MLLSPAGVCKADKSFVFAKNSESNFVSFRKKTKELAESDLVTYRKLKDSSVAVINAKQTIVVLQRNLCDLNKQYEQLVYVLRHVRLKFVGRVEMIKKKAAKAYDTNSKVDIILTKVYGKLRSHLDTLK